MTIASVSKARQAIALSFALAAITGIGVSSAAFGQEAECEGVCDAMYTGFIWKYGDSTVKISMDSKDGFVITYEQPRQGLIDEGVKSGDVMFSGKITDSDMIYGISRLRRRDCGAIDFQTSGAGKRQEGIITLTGKMPKRGPTCLVEKYIDANIELSRLYPIPGSPMAGPNAVQLPQQASIPVRDQTGSGSCRAPNGSVVQLDSTGCAAIGGSPPSQNAPAVIPGGFVPFRAVLVGKGKPPPQPAHRCFAARATASAVKAALAADLDVSVSATIDATDAGETLPVADSTPETN